MSDELLTFTEEGVDFMKLCVDVTAYWSGSAYRHAKGLTHFYRQALALIGDNVKYAERDDKKGSSRITPAALERLPQWLSGSDRTKDIFSIRFEGGARRHVASDTAFYLLANEYPEKEAGGIIRLVLPIATIAKSPTKLLDIALSLVKELRFHSGHAGYSVNWDPLGSLASRAQRRMGLLAERFPGIDLPQTMLTVMALPTGMKRVNWVTLIGNDLLKAKKVGLTKLDTRPLRHGVAIIAGDRPKMGDLKRREDMRAYHQVGAALAKLRTRSHAEFVQNQKGMADPRKTEEWLAYFDTAKSVPARLAPVSIPSARIQRRPLILSTAFGPSRDQAVLLAHHPAEAWDSTGYENARARTFILSLEGSRAKFVEEMRGPMLHSWYSKESGTGYCSLVWTNQLRIRRAGKWSEETFREGQSKRVFQIFGFGAARSQGDVLFVGTGKFLHVRRKGKWTSHPFSVGAQIHGRDPSRVYIGGNPLGFWDGAKLSQLESPPDDPYFRGLWTTNDGQLITGGQYLSVRAEDGSWTRVRGPKHLGSMQELGGVLYGATGKGVSRWLPGPVQPVKAMPNMQRFFEIGDAFIAAGGKGAPPALFDGKRWTDIEMPEYGKNEPT